jgi:nucleotide-binding universal stress UspA family protein
MFRHLFVPTDGSELSRLAIKGAVSMARETGARITGFHAVERIHGSAITYARHGSLMTQADFEKQVDAVVRDYLAVIENAARAAGVPCSAFYEISARHPWEAIIDAAQKRECDLIFMASHGRKGINALLMGSETQKVLTHCRIPVLVYR